MSGGMMYKQRDIVLIPFPYSDLTGAKRRPALIISNQRLKGVDKMCCLVTSNIGSEGIMIEKNVFENGSLPFKSMVKPHRLFTIHERIIEKRLCTINKEFHGKVLDELNKFISAN